MFVYDEQKQNQFKVFQLDIIATGATALFNAIFGGSSASAGGYNSAGVFIPGDIQSRQTQTAAWMAAAGLTTADISSTSINTILDTPSGWQAAIQQYIANVAAKKIAGTNQPNLTPTNTNTGLTTTAVLSNKSTSTTSASLLSGGTLTTVLLIGAGVFIVTTLIKSK
jgi:hypothetical protein